MNTKLIVVWIIAIVVFAGIGLFGMANQHLLEEDIPSPTPTPNPQGTTTEPVNTTHTVSCVASMPNGNSSYTFTISDATNSITNLTIGYQALSAVDYIYSSAQNLTNININGITTNITGTESDFSLQINVDMENYDSTLVSNYQSDLTNVYAVINNTQDVTSYEALINSVVSNLGSVYNCN